MPSFYTFDERRFTKEWSERLTGAMLKSGFENHTYEDIDHMNTIIDHARQENAEGNPRAGQPVTVDNLTKRDIKTLYAFSQMSEAAVETLTALILLASISRQAKLN